MTRRHNAFTLIELLVVIAIIAILAAILFPVFAQAKAAAKKTVALSSAKEISLAFHMYAGDFDDMCVLTGTYPPSGQPFTPTINNASYAAGIEPYDEMLAPYIKSWDLWHVPADGVARESDIGDDALWDGQFKGKPARLSFNYVSHLDTNQAGGWLDRNTGMAPFLWDVSWYGYPVRSLTEFSDPSNTISFAEIWTAPDASGSGGGARVGVLNGSVMFGCDTWKLAGRVPLSGAPGDRLPVGGDGCDTITRDPNRVPTTGYNGTANYSMADGSAKSLSWGAVRGNDFNRFKIQKPTQTYVP